MADAFTPNLNLTKPGDGESEDTWGVKLNGNLDIVDGLFTTGPALTVSKGGTGGTDAATARTNLGLGTIATQDADNVTLTGGVIDGIRTARLTSTFPALSLGETDASVGNKNWQIGLIGGLLQLRLFDDAWSSATAALTVTRSGNSPVSFNFTGPLQVSGSTVWHAGNDGAGSALDADLLDGQQGTFYTNASNMASGNLPVARLPTAALRNQGAFTGGAVTISDQAPSGTPAPGDIWLRYV